jgi:uncharacterized protein with WD repeat
MDKMCKLREFRHKHIAGFELSQDEKYIYFYDSLDKKTVETLWVCSVETERQLRDFSDVKVPPNGVGWSFDGKYLGKLMPNALSVYETPEMHMLMDSDGKRTSITAEYIKAFAWSPTQNILAIYRSSAHPDSQPSTILLVAIPSREVIYLKSIQGIESCSLRWHPKGHLLAILLNYKQASTGLIQTTMGILHMDKQRIEYVQEETSQLSLFEWEPTDDNHFAILRLQKDQLIDKMETVLEVYSIATFPLKVIRLPEVSYRLPLSHIHWSPLGRMMVAVRLVPRENFMAGANYGMLHFFYVKGNQAHTINTENHDNAVGAGWDPSGRYYTSYVASIHRLEQDSYKIYNCFGEIMHDESIPKLQSVKRTIYFRSGNGDSDPCP